MLGAWRLRWFLILVCVFVVVGCSRDAGEGAGGAAPHSSGHDTMITIQSFALGMSVPLVVADPDDGSGRLFVVDQTGQILVVDENGNLLEEPFLDLADHLVDIDPSYDERGLLGLAFHPDYGDNGRFFVYYSAPLAEGASEDWDHTSHVSEFGVSDDPLRADPETERVVLRVDQPYSNHNAGQIEFGPDGFLYIPLGDGGNAGDVDEEGEDRGRPEMGHAQTPETLLGSILRIDVDGGDPYQVPGDNVFADGSGAAEIYAYGFRNPYGISFDLETGELYAADAGQALFEEISRVEPGGNHGWNIKEGTHCFDPEDFLNPPAECPDAGPLGEPLVDPVIQYERGPETGSVVVPGVMYRGEGVPELQGRLLFGDYGSIRYLPTGVLYAATPREGALWDVERVGVSVDGDQPTDLERFLLGVDQDADGRLYLLTTREGGPTGETGEVFLVTDAEREGDRPWLPVIVVGALVLLIGIVVAIVVGRSRRDTAPGGRDVT